MVLRPRHDFPSPFKHRHIGEEHVGALCGEVAPVRRRAGRHDRGQGLLQAQWISGQAAQFVKAAIPVEFRPALQKLAQDLEPFKPLLITLVAINGDAMDVELVLVPAADDVEAGAPMGHMVEGRQRLGRESGAEQRRMHRDEQADPLGQGAYGCAMAEGLERVTKHIRLAAKALPLGHRQNEIDTSLIRHEADRDQIVPPGAPALGGFGDGEAAIAVGVEKAELEPIGAQHGIGDLSHCHLNSVCRQGRCSTAPRDYPNLAEMAA